MNLNEKIEKIRRQPEPVRLRYIWACVSISMFLIITVWLLSLSTSFSTQRTSTEDFLKQNVGQEKLEPPSLQNLLENPQQSLGKLSEENTNKQKTPLDNEGFVLPAPQSDASFEQHPAAPMPTK